MILLCRFRSYAMGKVRGRSFYKLLLLRHASRKSIPFYLSLSMCSPRDYYWDSGVTVIDGCLHWKGLACFMLVMKLILLHSRPFVQLMSLLCKLELCLPQQSINHDQDQHIDISHILIHYSEFASIDTCRLREASRPLKAIADG